jgi:hypothetical protein
LKPLTGVTVTLNIWLEPRETVTADGAVTVKSVPVPLSATVCGLPLASSVTVSVPVRLPVAVGLNVTLGWQLDAAVRVAPHGFGVDTAKSPEAVIEAMFSVALPLFFRVTGWPVLVVVTSCPGNVKFAGVRTATGAVAEPVPVRVTDCGLLTSTSVKTSLADSAPATEGLNVTSTVQEAPAATLPPAVGQVELAKIA